jgi:hypothetical protein
VVGAYVRRGLVAGLLAGVLSGLVAFGVGEPALSQAVALEEQQDSPAGPSRTVQRLALVPGYALVGLAIGALFGVGAAWAQGRVAGDGWIRSLKLGGVCFGALAFLPALRYPPNPPGAEGGGDVGTSTGLYLVLGLAGLLLAAAAWSGVRQLAAAGVSRATRQTVVGITILVAAGAMLALLPGRGGADGLPAELVWRFRLASLASQSTFYGGLGVIFGLLSVRQERIAAAVATP